MTLRPLATGLLAITVACGGATAPTPPAPTPTEPTPGPAPSEPAPAPTPIADATIVGAGDIAKCGGPEAELTAKLLDRIPGTVVALGDTVYPSATSTLLNECYGPTWGRHRARTLAVAGNHDWEVSSGAPFFAFFGDAAGPAGRGYFGAIVGAWQVLILNSNVAANPGSAQYSWLQAELGRSTSVCRLALWHHPVFSSGVNGNSTQMREIWRLLQSAGADVVMSGHDHDYERFAPQNADGQLDPLGMREFVSGTGGASLYDRVRPQPNAEAYDNRTFGVLRLTLKSTSYEWQFVPIDGQRYTDAGTASCVVR